ncbi:MAG: NFACT family protein [Clostridia bacterium]|nr:NFACT family protein [Clostridia bacterium]
MAFDAGTLFAVLEEISRACLGARVEKIYQPTKDEVVFFLRGKKLSLNVGSICPRISLTDISKDNPAVPPMFCMLLRKHLCPAVLVKIEQCGFDRVCKLTFMGRDEMGFSSEKHLYAEMMGKYSNIIVTDGKEKIIAVLKPIDFSDSEIRQLLPGLTYRPPSVPEKKNPLTVTKEEWQSAIVAYPQERGVTRFLSDTFGGTALSVFREIAFRALGQTDVSLVEANKQALYSAFCAWFSALKEGRLAPSITRNEKGEPLEYSYLPLTYFPDSSTEKYPTFSTLFDAFFGERERIERIHLRAQDLLRLVTRTKAKLEKKLSLQREEWQSASLAESYRKTGDLITANLYRLKKGMLSFVAVDYEKDPPDETVVALDSRYTPAQNAQKNYKLYAKAKKAREILAEQVAVTEKELAYMETVLHFLQAAETEADLSDIRDELYHAGYGSKMRRYTPQKNVKVRPLQYKTSGGYTVLCGRNNLQNDILTFKTAKKTDIWFHVKGLTGAHVILVCGEEEPNEQDYTEAAEIAAYHSCATTDLVAVDYTRVKNVKKPPAAKPGFVTYKTNYTAYVHKRESLAHLS